MSSKPVEDLSIEDDSNTLATNLRNVMVFCRNLREQGNAAEADGLKVIEDFLFALSGSVDGLKGKIMARLEEYREVAEAADSALKSVDRDDTDMVNMLAMVQRGLAMMDARLRGRAPVPEPAPVVPSNVVVFTGSYCPPAANDAGGRS